MRGHGDTKMTINFLPCLAILCGKFLTAAAELRAKLAAPPRWSPNEPLAIGPKQMLLPALQLGFLGPCGALLATHNHIHIQQDQYEYLN